jgi:hypothetical protein
MHMLIELTGTWKGVITYGNSYPKAVAGKTLSFKIDISQQHGGVFSGECLDLDDIGKHIGAAAIKGTVTASLIRFIKEYSVLRLINDAGTSFIQHDKPGLRVNYTGQWNEEHACFEGDWEIGNPKALLIRMFAKQPQKGTWQMQREEVSVLPIPIVEDLTIEMHYRRGDLEAVYYKNGGNKMIDQPGILHLVYYIMAALIFLGISYMSAMTYESVGWIMMCIISVLLIITFGGLLIKNIIIYLKWRDKVNKSIRCLVKEQRHTLSINSKTLTLQTPNELSIERWEHIKEVKIKDDHIVLSGDQPKYLFFASSMQSEEYELLKSSIQQYVKGT